MNALSLVQRVSRRVPGYQQSEYLDEINAVYYDTWNYIVQLDESYFTDRQIVTVQSQAAQFDFLYNKGGALSAAVSPRYVSIDMLEVNQPGDTNWIPATPLNWNSPEWLAIQQDSTSPAQTNPPYCFSQFSKGTFLFARPFLAGTQLRVTYTLGWLPLVILNAGTVTSSGLSIAGTGTAFTQLVPPDFQATSLPGQDIDVQVAAEIILPAANQTYQIDTITNDFTATTRVAVSSVTDSAYTLASVPDIPQEHHPLIATMATRNFMSTPGDDPRFTEWAALSQQGLDAMRDTVMTRQNLQPPRRGRFPFGLTRGTSFPSVSR